MPSSTELSTDPRADVRPVRFDRPLAGAAAAATGAAWGDPALDAVLAEAVENARREGLAQGYAAGWAAGRRDADDVARVEAAERAGRLRIERDAVLAAARGLLEALAEAAARRPEEPAWADLADTLADGALTIARAALARELNSVDDDVAARVRSALHALAGDGALVLHLAPADAALLTEHAPDGAVLVADPSLAPGTVVVRGETQRLRLDVPAAVAAAEEVLRS
jgi:flagellar assembly protein FliH